MSQSPQAPEFDDVADCFWRLGVMTSPSQLQGYLLGQLANGSDPGSAQWLAQAAAFIDAVEPPGDEDNQCLLALYTANFEGLTAGELDLQLLLPDDEVELPLRITAVGEWCQGFLKGFAVAGKSLQEQQGQLHYGADVSEALSDIAAISQISVDGEEVDLDKNEQDYFDICEYLRLAVVNIYLDCQAPAAVRDAAENTVATDEQALTSAANLFKNKLH
jgi:hypothetical protein